MEIHESDIPDAGWQDCGNGWRRACFIVGPSDALWCGKSYPVYTGNSKWEIWQSAAQTKFILHDADAGQVEVTWVRELTK